MGRGLGVAFGLAVGVGLGVELGVTVGVELGVALGVGVGLTSKLPWALLTIMLSCCCWSRSRCSSGNTNVPKDHDRVMKTARRQADSCRNIESAITIKISHCPKNGRVADTVPQVREQAAVRVYDKDRHIIRCIVKHHEIRRSIAVHVTRFPSRC